VTGPAADLAADPDDVPDDDAAPGGGTVSSADAAPGGGTVSSADAASGPRADATSGAELAALVERVPLGWTRILVAGEPWGVTRLEHGGGRSVTIEAERLGGAGFVSANVWRTASGTLLRPCEMPAERVLDFLRALPGR
jgi:hypothetical protein